MKQKQSIVLCTLDCFEIDPASGGNYKIIETEREGIFRQTSSRSLGWDSSI